MPLGGEPESADGQVVCLPSSEAQMPKVACPPFFVRLGWGHDS